MEMHFQRELDKLKKSLLTLGAMVEEAVRLSIKALETRDVALANKVIDGDSEIDEKVISKLVKSWDEKIPLLAKEFNKKYNSDLYECVIIA